MELKLHNKASDSKQMYKQKKQCTHLFSLKYNPFLQNNEQGNKKNWS